MSTTTNPQLELAWQYISQTKRHVYLTGKAGTGKTTFLHRIRREVPKHMAVVAPTGVAAINAKGQTIHSLFQLPFGLIRPGDTREKCRRFSKKKIQLLNSLDLLVIDEISMVRADVLDGIDEVLRRIRRNDRPFGGLQLLMIGDLHQLPPVVKDYEQRELLQLYRTPYFFGSRALQKADPATIELSHIYRQSDEKFIALLNRVRNDDMDDAVFATLNERYRPGFDPVEAEGYITLTSHNNAAHRINEDKLRKLVGERFDFKATVTGKFPESMYPNTIDLSFKVGAQVMFNKNDTVDHLYYNGKIGKVTAIKEGLITVRCPDDDFSIEVSPVSWENVSYEMNALTKSVDDNVVGTFTQHPLKLAWAITIHKSQGLTFEKVVIDAADAFAHGQVYVALSRCKTFEGIILRSRIGNSSVKTDRVVSDYSEASAENQPTEEDLQLDKRAFQLDCLRELFGFRDLHDASAHLRRALFEYEHALQGGKPAEFAPISKGLAERAINPGRKFLPELNAWGHPKLTAEQQQKLNERLAAAGVYFTKYLKNDLTPALTAFDFLTDNQKVRDIVGNKLTELRLATFVRLRTFESLADGFDAANCVRARTAARLEFAGPEKRSARTAKSTQGPAPKDSPHPELYRQLVAWRLVEADEREVPAFSIAHNSVLVDLTILLPRTLDDLRKVNKVGPKTCDRHGEDILKIVNAYVIKKNITPPELTAATVISLPTSTYQKSLLLFQADKSVAEIAAERNLNENTVLGHLARFVEEGVLPIEALVVPEVVAELLPFINEHPDAPAGHIHYSFGGKYEYGQIHAVRAHRNRLEKALSERATA